jgi:hypothetical protein
MDIECTEAYTDALVSILGNVRFIFGPVESERHLRRIWIGFGTNFHGGVVVQEDVMSIK